MKERKALTDMERYEKMQRHERLAAAQGYLAIAGIDEAGRGPLAGPVVAAACILNPHRPIYGLNDSKKLTPAKRKRLFQEILEDAVDFGIAEIDAATIDRRNIYQATCDAMCQAVAKMRQSPDLLLVDAVHLSYKGIEVWPIVRGDGHSISIAAASILAKVTRDELMQDMDAVYPGYGFGQHKGYGTKAHYEAILQMGPCPIHRRSFLRTIKKPLLENSLVPDDYFHGIE